MNKHQSIIIHWSPCFMQISSFCPMSFVFNATIPQYVWPAWNLGVWRKTSEVKCHSHHTTHTEEKDDHDLSLLMLTLITRPTYYFVRFPCATWYSLEGSHYANPALVEWQALISTSLRAEYVCKSFATFSAQIWLLSLIYLSISV